jgi:hypothetical protein
VSSLITVLVIGWVVLAFFTAWVAGTKGRGEGAWFVLGLLFGIIALIAVGLAPPIVEGKQSIPDREPKVGRDAIPWNPRKQGPPP